MKRMIVLDRDGVINEDSDDYIKSVDEWKPIEGSLESIARLKKAGYIVVVVSNQSGLARGYFDEDALKAMHDKMSTLLSYRGVEIDHIYYCPHGPSDNCTCRKPRPGMLVQAHKDFEIPYDQMLMVGDSLSDVQAAQFAGIEFVLVKTGKGLRTLEKPEELEGVAVYDNLAKFVRSYLREHHDELVDLH